MFIHLSVCENHLCLSSRSVRNVLIMSDREFNCPRCDKKYPLYQSLRRHWAITHGGGYFCVECGANFSVGIDWRRHIETVHLDRVLDGCYPNFRRTGASQSLVSTVSFLSPVCIFFIFLFCFFFFFLAAQIDGEANFKKAEEQGDFSQFLKYSALQVIFIFSSSMPVLPP